jgi:DNA adenine methylase
VIADKKMRSPIKWHGGKSYLARRIIGLFPPHEAYLEPFAGGLSVLLNKVPSKIEIACDLNPDLINFWTTIQANPLLIECLAGTDYGEDVFLKSKKHYNDDDFLVRAWSFMVRNRMSRSAFGRDFAWSERLRGKRRPGGAVPEQLNSWATIRESLPDVRDRIARVRFVHTHSYWAINNIADDIDALIYCDPPYLHETRTVKKAYEFEMAKADHERLLSQLLRVRAAVVISGYPSDLYDSVLSDWKRHEFDMPNHSGQGATKQRRTECVWIKDAS